MNRALNDDCDVLVIGGGPAGLAAAIDLRTSTGLEVIVAESRGASSERFGETLPPGTLAALDRLGLSAAFHADRHIKCPGSISLWGRDRPGHNDFILDPRGPAWHIDRARFEAMLRARAARAGAAILTHTRAVAVTREGDRFTVILRSRSGELCRSRPAWVIDATGGSAWFARRQGARRQRSDRMVALLRFAEIADGTFTAQSVVESTPTGWWYSARLPGTRLVTVLVTQPEAIGSLTRGENALWHSELAATQLLAPRLDSCSLRNPHFRTGSVPVSMLDRVDGDRWLAIGDAACERDPISGRGIHDALTDAADATRTIAAAAGIREPPYWRYADRLRARFTDHVDARTALYATERRWPNAPFWLRRAAAAEWRV
jgi:flavin-dependent dehydrogenase